MLKVTDHKNLIKAQPEAPSGVPTVFDIQRLVSGNHDKSFEVNIDPETNKVHFELYVDDETFLIVVDGALAAHMGSWLMEVGSVANFLEKSGMISEGGEI